MHIFICCEESVFHKIPRHLRSTGKIRTCFLENLTRLCNQRTKGAVQAHTFQLHQHGDKLELNKRIRVKFDTCEGKWL